MRKFAFTTPDGAEIELAATFEASMEIAEKVADPLHIAREAAISAQLGPMYQPKFAFTAKNVPQIIHTGMKAAGDKRTMKEAQDLVFTLGFVEAKEVAERYIAMMITPKSEELTKEDAGKPSGE